MRCIVNTHELRTAIISLNAENKWIKLETFKNYELKVSKNRGSYKMDEVKNIIKLDVEQNNVAIGISKKPRYIMGFIYMSEREILDFISKRRNNSLSAHHTTLLSRLSIASAGFTNLTKINHCDDCFSYFKIQNKSSERCIHCNSTNVIKTVKLGT